MSRFFTAGSSSEDESEDDRSSDDEVNEVKAPARFAKGSGIDSDSDSDGGDTPKKRVVKSARDKQFDELKETGAQIKNAISINDWNKIQDEFEKLNRQLTKAAQLVQKEGIPKFYIKSMLDIEEFVKSTTEKKPKMNATNQKSFNAMKQKIKKNNVQYEKEIEAYKKNPTEEEEEDESSEEDTKWMDESESEEEKEATTKDKPVKKTTFASDDDEDSEEPSDDDEDESSDGDDDEPTDRSKKWFKSTTKADSKDKDSKDDKDKDKALKDKLRQDRAKRDAELKAAGASASKTEERKPIEMSPEEVKAKLREILQVRGKRNTDPAKQSEKMNELLGYAKNPELQVEILVHLVSAQFDSSRGITSNMPVTLWKGCYNNLIRILNVLESNPSVELHEVEEITDQPAVDADEESAVKAVTGNLVAFVERLDDELTKSFQAIDPHTQEYVQRLQDENSLMDIMEKTHTYYMRKNKPKHAAHIAARQIEHVYYKLDAHTDDKSTTPAPESGTIAAADAAIKAAATANKSNKDLIESLSKLILHYGDERLKTRAMLSHIYYNALHDHYYQARDMMLMSHLQDSIMHMDIPTQILFNRAQVQIGLSAFRNSQIRAAYSCLAEVQAGGRVKELLAQGITNARYNDKSAEQEKQERKRQLPYHMHINLELLEAVHLICAMLLEVPNTAAHAYDVKKKVTSRFDKLLEIYDRQVFTGPPENTRDMIITASKHLSKGNWKKCEEQILGLNVWNLVHNSDQVKSMLRRKIQEEGLRTYLFTYSSNYKSMSLQQLSDRFELPQNNVHSLVSKMMINEELHASWDQPTGAIVMHGAEPSRLQYLAIQLADKAAGFVEVNERNSDPRNALGGYGYNKFGDNKGQKSDQRKGGDNRRNDDRRGDRGDRGDRGGQDRRKGQDGRPDRREGGDRDRNYQQRDRRGGDYQQQGRKYGNNNKSSNQQ